MTDETTLPDVLSMSDEDFLNASFPEGEINVEEASDEQSEEAATEETEETTESTSTDEVEETSEETSESGDSEETSEGTSDATEETADEESTEEGSDTEEGSGEKIENKEESIEDFEAQMKELFEPIKANGKENTVKDIEQARKLMQMGMGVNKRFEKLKSARLLENKMREHGLLDEGKLDYLIALDKQDPEAIAQLLKDAKLDPLKIDMESDSSFIPEAYSGGEDTLALDDVVTELENSNYAAEMADLISTKWGESSREILRSNPGLLTIIDSHMNLGIYDSITEQLEQERMLGSYMGVSDVHAYGQVAERMKGEGHFDHLLTSTQKPVVAQTPRTITKAIKPRVPVNPNLELKKASATTKSPPAVKQAPKAYLGMSDEDFLASM